MSNKFYGWFDDPTQPANKPTYDPPHDAPCLYCGEDINADDVRTHSVMYVGKLRSRSYFYRTHKSCAERDKEKLGKSTGMDGFVFDMIAFNGD